MDNPNSRYKIVTIQQLQKFILDYRENHSGELTLLHVGAGPKPDPKLLDGYKVTRTDLHVQTHNTIKMDVCEPFPFKDESFDVIYSNNVFEHLHYPWITGSECSRVCKSGGLNVHLAPFSWRYHPVPEDYFRYSHVGFVSLFPNSKTLLSGYDLSIRRKDVRGIYENKSDAVPLDDLGGWREHWETLVVLRKI